MRINKYLAMALSVAVCAGFAACGDDDDDPINGGDGGNVDTSRVPANSVYTTSAGNRVVLSELSGTPFTYDANGFCTKIGSNMNIFYSGSLIVIGEREQAKFTMNGNGFITGIDATRTEKNSNYEMKEESKIRLSYNNGYISKVTVESTGSYLDIEEGVDSYEKGTGEMTFTWDGGKLIKAHATSNYEEDGEKEIYVADYTIQSSGNANSLGQYTMAYADLFDDDFYMLSMVGMLGKAPAEFIRSVAVTSENTDVDGIDRENEVYNYDYGFNVNGTVSTETETEAGEYECTYNYKYSVLPTPVLAPAARSDVKMDRRFKAPFRWTMMNKK